LNLLRPNSNSAMIFDMDGLLLDSLDNLSLCMTQTVKEFCQSQEQLTNFVEYDLKNPGLSRFEKIDYFIDSMPIANHYNRDSLISEMLLKFDSYSLEARLNSRLDMSVFELENHFDPKRTVLLSNCDNQQLKSVVAHFGLHQVFRGGLVGTPPSKLERMKEISQTFNKKVTWSVSDSESDALIARELGLNFIFVQQFARDNAAWLASGELRYDNLKMLLNDTGN